MNRDPQTQYDEQLKQDELQAAFNDLTAAIVQRSGWDDRDRMMWEIYQAFERSAQKDET